MKSFKKFLNERRSEDIKRLRQQGEIKSSEYDDIEDYKREKEQIKAEREKLKNKPVLSDKEMRAQNPDATAAFEREVTRKKRLGGPTQTIPTPEGDIITNMPKGSSTPEEVVSRLETKPQSQTQTPSSTSTPSIGGKPKRFRNIQKPSGRVIRSTTTPPATPTPQNIDLGDTSLPKTSKAPKVTPVSVSKPKALKAPKVTQSMSAKDIGKTVDKVLKNREARIAVEKAKGALKFTKALKGAGTALGIIGSGLEAKTGYETARGEGASQRRSLGAGAARGLGSFVGGAAGATLGSVLGLPGAIAGGAAGYTAGANIGSAAYKALTGDPLKKLTTKGLQTNIRKAVPYEIRRQVPAETRKAFSDFVTQAGRTYGNWSRSQQQRGNK